MSFFDLVQERHSVRKFSERKVEKETLLQILEVARLAPSAVNFQPWHFVVVTDDELKKKISEAYSRDWFKAAPVVIVALGNHETAWKRKDGKDHCDIDLAIAVDHLILAATEAGLGTCWVCAFNASLVHSVLELPENLEPVVLIPLGYPAEEEIPEKKRKSLDQIVSWNGYHFVVIGEEE